MHGKRRKLQRRTKKEWMCEAIEVEVEVVLEVVVEVVLEVVVEVVLEVVVEVVLEVVVEEDVVGVNGKENLMWDFDCIKYNPYFICTEYSTNWVQEKYSNMSRYLSLQIFAQVKDILCYSIVTLLAVISLFEFWLAKLYVLGYDAKFCAHIQYEYE
jgi:hypothetical protein